MAAGSGCLCWPDSLVTVQEAYVGLRLASRGSPSHSGRLVVVWVVSPQGWGQTLMRFLQLGLLGAQVAVRGTVGHIVVEFLRILMIVWAF